jgi:hypothetical protein
VDKKTPAVEASAKIVATKHAVTKQAATGEAAIEAAEDVTVSAGGGGASWRSGAGRCPQEDFFGNGGPGRSAPLLLHSCGHRRKRPGAGRCTQHPPRRRHYRQPGPPRPPRAVPARPGCRPSATVRAPRSRAWTRSRYLMGAPPAPPISGGDGRGRAQRAGVRRARLIAIFFYGCSCRQ